MFLLLCSFFAWSHNAAFEVEDSIVVFHAGMHVAYKKGASEAVKGYPKETDEQSFPGLDRYRTRTVAALNLDQHTVVFFLSDSKSIVYDAKKKQIVQEETIFSDTNWKGLAPYGSLISAAFRINEHHAYFFLKNGSVLRYDFEKQEVEENYPKDISQTIWNTIDPAWGAVEHIFSWNKTSIYLFFSSQQYVRFNRDVYAVDDGYPKLVDERKWPGMGEWMTTDFRVPLIEWDRQELQENDSVVLQLPYQIDPERGTTIASGRYLVADEFLGAVSEYPDSRSVFRVIPITLNKTDPTPFVQYVLLKSADGFLVYHKGDWITRESQSEAEIIRLDARWGDHVVLFSSRRGRCWSQRNTIRKKEPWIPLSFVLEDAYTSARSKQQVDGASLLILRKVVPTDAKSEDN